MTWFFKILNATDPSADTIELAIYDAIGKDFFGDGVGAADVLSALRAKPNAKSILVRVNSPGGFMDDAKAMLTLLAERAASGVAVEFRVDSLAASAAAYLLTTPGARVTVADNAFVMVHKTRAIGRGTDSDFIAMARRLAAENQILIDAFAAASARRGKGKTAADFTAAMANNADRYFSATEAVEWGLADAVAAADLKVAACTIDLSGLEPPDALLRQPYARASAPAPVAPVARAAAPPGSPPNPSLVSRQASLSFEPPPPSSGQAPAVAGKDESTMDLKVLAKLLGLAETATEAEVTAALNKRLEPPETSVSVSGVKLLGVATEAEASAKIQELQRGVLQVLGSTGKATIAESMAVILDWKTGSEQTAQLTKQVAQLTEEFRIAKRDAAIARLSAENILPPARHEWARMQFPTAEAVETFCAGMPKGFFDAIREPKGQVVDVAITDEERKICATLGMSEQQYLEEKKLLANQGKVG